MKRFLPPASSGDTYCRRQIEITGCFGQDMARLGEEIRPVLRCGYSSVCKSRAICTLEQFDPEASTWYTLQPRWQQRAALHKAKARIKQSCNLHGAVQQAGIQQKLLPKDRQCFWLRHLHILRLVMLCSLLPGMQAALWTLACPRELSSLQRYRNMQPPTPQTGEHEGATGAKHRHNCLDCREPVTLAHSCLYKP